MLGSIHKVHTKRVGRVGVKPNAHAPYKIYLFHTPVSVFRWLPKFHRIVGQSCGQMTPEWDFFHGANPVVSQKFTGHRVG